MPKVTKRSLGFVLVTCLAIVGALLFPANADASVHGASVAPVVAQVSTTGLALSGDEDPLALCNAPADSSTPGEGGYTAPAPMKLDASGTDQDAICIPDDFDHPNYSWGGYYRDGNNITVGFNKVNGATSVTITSSYHSGTWTFSFPNDQPGEEAENKYWIDVSPTCKTDLGGTEQYREATAYTTNEDDVTDIMFNVWPEVIDKRGIVTVADTEAAYNIPDGSTASMRVMEYESWTPGLRPGRYLVKFWQSYSGVPWDGNVVKRMELTVPRCDGSTGGTSQRARGKLSRVGCRAVRVTADTRGFTAAPSVTYRVVRKAYGKVGHARTFVVPQGKRYVKYLPHFGHRWSRVKLLVQRTDGHWAKLSQLLMHRCRR